MQAGPADFDKRITSLDLALFRFVEGQSSEGDRRAWLAMQNHARNRHSEYCYLEIGSHLGGSLQQHVPDPRCVCMYSIDPRPAAQPDNRGECYEYEHNSTERMLKNLAAVPGALLDRLHCFDLDASAVPRSGIVVAPNCCFIDGEHTTKAVLSDFEFCLSVCRPDAIIAFHDDAIVFPAIDQILTNLRRKKVSFVDRKFRDGSTFALFLGSSHLDDPVITSLSTPGADWVRQRRLVAMGKQILPSWAQSLVRRIRS